MPGRLNKRLELAIDEDMDAAIRVVTKEVAGGGDPKMFRSLAARTLIQRGIDGTPGLGRKAARLLREEEARGPSTE